MTGKFDLDARTFALGDRAAERFDQRLDVCEGDGRPRGLGEDRGERLSVSGVHGDTIAESAIVLRLAVKARAALSWTVLLHKAPRLVAPGRISKQGDRYLRMLLTHGARSVLQQERAHPVGGDDPRRALRPEPHQRQAGCAARCGHRLNRLNSIFLAQTLMTKML
jgi:hypothetical protein